MSMWAPLVEPCCASYMEVLTRTSVTVSGAGVGKAWPIAKYTDAVLWIGAAPLVEPCCASYMEVLTRTSVTVSGAGVGKAWPIAKYTDAVLWIGAALVL